jgi:hypothetical protein
MLALLILGAITVTRGMYRSGFQEGFVRGMAFSAGDGVSAADAALPAFGGWQHGRLGPMEGVSLGFGLLGFAFFAFCAFLIMTALGHFGRHRWAHHHDRRGHDGWGHHRYRPTDGEPDRTTGVGPEKQPEEYL